MVLVVVVVVVVVAGNSGSGIIIISSSSSSSSMSSTKELHQGISSGMPAGSTVLLVTVNSSHRFCTVIHTISILKPVILSDTYFNTGLSFLWYAVFGFWEVVKEIWLAHLSFIFTVTSPT
jgi:hypothetical protein